MSSLILRDWGARYPTGLRSTSGSADAPVYPYQTRRDLERHLAITKETDDFTYPASSGKDLIYRRSLYTFWSADGRARPTCSNASNRQTCRVRSGTTSTPLHALTTLNDPTWVDGRAGLWPSEA